MKFDLEKAPPSEAELVAARAACEGAIRRCRQLDLVCVGPATLAMLVVLWEAKPMGTASLAGLILASLIWVGTVWGQMNRGDGLAVEMRLLGGSLLAGFWLWGGVAMQVQVACLLAGVAAAVLVAVAAVDWSYDQFIDKPRERARACLAELEAIKPHEGPSVLAWCLQQKALRDYQSAVAKQNRLLVAGEVEAMRAWVDTRRARAEREEREAEQQDAWDALRRPVGGQIDLAGQ